MNWLITGGCGFIGRNLIRSLLADEFGHRIRVVDNLTTGKLSDLAAVCTVVELNADNLNSVTPPLASNTVELVIGDIKDRSLAMQATMDFNIVVHLAGDTGVAMSVTDPLGSCQNNVVGTLNYLEASRIAKVEKFIFASSGAPIGDCEPPLHEELPAHPVSPYGASKLCGEAYCSAYKRSFGLETVCLRFSNVYGPLSGHKGSVVAKFIRDAIEDRPWKIYGNGEQTRDFIYIDDLVAATKAAAICSDIGGEVFQVASGLETSVIDLANKLKVILLEAGIETAGIRSLPKRVGDVERNFSDTRKANSRLGWACQTNLEQGLRATVDWFRGEINGGQISGR